ncbi:unnamed protein product [Linum tenue]|uniref:Uncharacterized protein n=1 Tax=Linum tenue TaxID=586396 RepID=A0AAV0S1K0_9ROSI|nr:unnamed protein product [Linum tenue]
MESLVSMKFETREEILLGFASLHFYDGCYLLWEMANFDGILLTGIQV